MYVFFGLVKKKDQGLQTHTHPQKKMGTNTSTSIERNIQESVTTQTTSLLQQFVQANAQNTVNTQEVNIVVNGKLSCASLSITNDAKVSMRSLSQITAQQNNDMQTFVTQALDNASKAQFDQENKGLSAAQTNATKIVREQVELTRNEQKLACTQSFQQTITQTSNNTQRINLTVGENGEIFITGDCVFNNTASVTYTADQVVSATMAVVLGSEQVQKAASDWDTAVKQQNKGLSLGAIIGIALGIFFFLVAIGLMAHFLPPVVAKAKANKATAAAGKTTAPKTTAKK